MSDLDKWLENVSRVLGYTSTQARYILIPKRYSKNPRPHMKMDRKQARIEKMKSRKMMRGWD